MRLKRLELAGFKSFGKKTTLLFDTPITAIVGPNGSGKSNVAEAFRWVLGEQSLKSLRGKRGEDLIFNGGDSGARGNRASVTVAFDNSDKIFGVDFEEVTLTRIVHRDGVNDYELNGSKVRLRDMLELLAKVSLGASGHTIVSQGDADRILLASVYERKTMIEESLGLKVYQWKLSESERKLEKTADNIRQVESLRREILPHLKFLKKQVEKIERADELRRDLKTLYREYLAREAFYLQQAKEELVTKRHDPETKMGELEKQIAAAERLAENGETGREENEQIAKYESELTNLRRQRDDLARTLGRLEGMIEVKAARVDQTDEMLPAAIVHRTLSEIDRELSQIEVTSDWTAVRNLVSGIRGNIAKFLSGARGSDEALQVEVANLKQEIEKSKQAQEEFATREQTILTNLAKVKKDLEQKKLASQGAVRELYELRARRTEARSLLDALKSQEEKLRAEEADLKREVEEGEVLVDREIRTFVNAEIGAKLAAEDRTAQEKRRKDLERLKIRLEDMGVESTDVLNEYKQANERDEFLAKELIDLEEAKTSLVQVIAELKEKLETEFTSGLKKINEEFTNYFSLMFGGGSARLDLLVPEKKKKKSDLEIEEMPEDLEPEDTRPGIDIAVNLPRKKIRGLQMLSGGERALTSIALLFAIASVNPPPFLILDETDAALDEANSRKYGEMIATLAQSSQLILITHNRETMSRAGVLYGVTMGGDGVSKILSVRFEEAQSFAK